MYLDLDACLSEMFLLYPQLQPTTVLNTVILERGVQMLQIGSCCGFIHPQNFGWCHSELSKFSQFV